MKFCKPLASFCLLSTLFDSNAKRIGEEKRELAGFGDPDNEIDINADPFFRYYLDIPCFSSQSTADVKGRGPVPMDQVVVGDEVLTGKGTYEPIYTMAHRHPTKTTEFVQIYYASEADPLELTDKHMLFLGDNSNPVPAATVKIGDHVRTLDGPREVTNVSTVTRDGVFNPHTPSGTIVVSGVVASVYSALTSDNEWLEVAGRKVMSHESFFHKLTKPHRLFCTGVSLELCKTNNEYVGFVKMGVHFLNYYKQQGESYQAVLGAFIVGLACFWDIVFSPVSLVLIATSIIWKLTKKSKKKVA